MYESFAAEYDRFVNWNSRLAYELPFIGEQIRLQQGQAGTPLEILDSACGTGMHAISLARLGHRVSGADLFPQMIEKARLNADAAGVPVNFAAAGFGEMEKTFGSAHFDLLLCLGNSLPHLLSLEEVAATLFDFAASLLPGGRLLIQNRNFDAVVARQERWMEPQVFSEGGREWIFQRFYDFLPDGLIRFNIVTLQRAVDAPWQSSISSTFLRPQLSAELENELATAGFKDIRAYGSMTGEAYDAQRSGNLILTAVKS